MDSSKDTQKQWLKDRFHETPTSGPEAKKVKFSDVKDELETQFVSAKFSSYTVSHLIRDTFPNTMSKPAGKSRQQYVLGWAGKFQLVPPILAHPAHMILCQVWAQINLHKTIKPVASLISFSSVHRWKIASRNSRNNPMMVWFGKLIPLFSINAV